MIGTLSVCDLRSGAGRKNVRMPSRLDANDALWYNGMETESSRLKKFFSEKV